ncbi:MAG: hypothetical protein N2712_07115 [Brevinematales bacterium]|nr:hypothetical protein [Brevinematales bacterium]
MKYAKIFLSLLLVAAVALSMSLVSCAPAPQDNNIDGGGGDTGGPAGITIIFDFGGTFLPENYEVVPFIVGSLDQINPNKFYAWDGVVNNGIKQDGTGSHVLSKIDAAKWKLFIPDSDILLDPDTPTAVQFKAANYNPSDWDSVVDNFWGTIGNQLTGMNNEKIVISNKQVIEAYKPGDDSPVKPGQSDKGITISPDGKTVTIDVGAHGGWSIHLPYTVTNVELVLITSNVSTNYSGSFVVEYGYSGSFNGWGGPLVASILSTNANGRVNIIATANYTGSAKVEYKVRGRVGADWQWATGENMLILIPKNVTKYTNYSSRDVDF